jgi:hypothetical protein
MLYFTPLLLILNISKLYEYHKFRRFSDEKRRQRIAIGVFGNFEFCNTRGTGCCRKTGDQGSDLEHV